MTTRAGGSANGPRGPKAASVAPKTEKREKGRKRTDLDELFTADGDRVAVQRQKRQELQEQALRLLASARVEGVPPRFDGIELMLTIHYWRRELLEQRIGPEPLKADKDALGEVSAAAKRLAAKLDRLNAAMDAPASRIADSRFTAPWPRERLHALRREMIELAVAAGSREVEEDMRRPNILPGKPKGGWSAQEAFFGYDLPMLYQQMFPGRRFTVSGKEDADPSEGVRFACAVAAEVLGYEVEPATIVRIKSRFEAARGGQRGPK